VGEIMSNNNYLETLLIKLPWTFEELQMREKEEMARVQKASEVAPKTWTPEFLAALPSKVDYSSLIPFVRHQGAYGCGMNAGSACWDIMNEKICPYSPNISVNRQIWAWARILHKFEHGDTIDMGVFDYFGVEYKTLDEYLIKFGCPTEGTELTDSDGVRWPTLDGDYEAPNYKMASPPSPVKVDVNEFKMWLAKGPLRVTIWGNHFVAVIGYDDVTQRFIFINSWGDQWGDNGFGYVEYSKLNQEVQGAEFFTFVPSKSVPSARIKFTHSYRQDIYLWIGVEGRPYAKRIWPNEQRQDGSKNLTLTVTLPRGFIWPPEPGNRLYLDVFDSGGRYETGGEMIEFIAAFCGQTFKCNQLSTGSVHFNPHQNVRFYIP
jgi:hypothetical protein